MHANENTAHPLRISITLDYLISVDGKSDPKQELERDILFRLNYDKDEIPVGSQTFDIIARDLEATLPNDICLNRIGGTLSLNRAIVKHF
ncbi:MAG: hypothetical protein VX941_02390 [Pseudomonadota bacterium]|nr:hypothetical protein [Pseudomonadota bacterium]